MTDWGELYRDHVAALSALATSLTGKQITATVPASPDWTVREVYAHVTGGASDILSGRMDGAPGPGWTARHVGERAGVPLPDLVAELASRQDEVAASVDGSAFPAAVFDIAVHHADLHEGLGLGVMPERLWLPVAEAMAPRARGLQTRVAPYELFRAVFSRRSRGQMRAWGTGLSAEELDEVGVFGPRDDDQPVPT